MRITIDGREGMLAFGARRSFLAYIHPLRYSRAWMTVLLGLSDLLSLVVAFSLALGLRSVILDGIANPKQYLHLIPFLSLFILAYAGRGLYPGVGLSPIEELRRMTISTSITFILVAAISAWTHTTEIYSRLVFLFAWLFALVLVQLCRWLVRILAVRLGVWGEPVAVVGYGPQGQQLVEFLQNNMRFGLRPVVVLDGFSQYRDIPASIPKLNIGSPEAATEPLNLAGIQTALLVTSELPITLQESIVDHKRFGFRRLILMPNLNWIGSLAVTPYEMEGFLGLEIRQNLLNGWQQAWKRLIDTFVVLVVFGCGWPAFALLAILVRLDSKGPIFYGHKRLGKDSRPIRVWKFRTMIINADQVLQEYLESSPAARQEWANTQKLKDDPRVTRFGRILRKLSLDELPQLWNVLKGEMSLVGPRPIVNEEVKHYSKGYKLYTQVRPGITGMWQVSGRNDVGYADRVRLDEYYVRNWSLWLDIYILLRTIWVVLRRDGAY